MRLSCAGRSVKNEETREPPTTHERAITSFLVARRQCVNIYRVSTTQKRILAMKYESLTFIYL